MTVTTEVNDLTQFKFWSGALDRARLFKTKELDTILGELESLYPDGMTETELNDLFWFDCDWLCGLVGMTEEELFEREKEDED